MDMEKIDDLISILQLIRSRGKKLKETEAWLKKDGFKPGPD